jgi:hypothetical protein
VSSLCRAGFNSGGGGAKDIESFLTANSGEEEDDAIMRDTITHESRGWDPFFRVRLQLLLIERSDILYTEIFR